MLRRLMMLSALLLAIGPSWGDQRDFAWSYQWWTPTVGEHELELYGTYHSDQNEFEPWIEYETGLTDRWGIGVYAMFKVSDVEAFGFEGVKVENRYRFGEFRRDTLLHAAYLEVEKEDAAPWKLEGKWLMSWYGRRGDNLALNLILEQKLSEHAHLEFGYTAGWSHELPGWRLGLEHTGHINDQEYYLGPTATFELPTTSRLVANVMAGLTGNSSDVAARVIFQHEFF